MLICKSVNGDVVNKVQFGDGDDAYCSGKDISSFDIETSFSVALSNIEIGQ